MKTPKSRRISTGSSSSVASSGSKSSGVKHRRINPVNFVSETFDALGQKVIDSSKQPKQAAKWIHKIKKSIMRNVAKVYRFIPSSVDESQVAQLRREIAALQEEEAKQVQRVRSLVSERTLQLQERDLLQPPVLMDPSQIQERIQASSSSSSSSSNVEVGDGADGFTAPPHYLPGQFERHQVEIADLYEKIGASLGSMISSGILPERTATLMEMIAAVKQIQSSAPEHLQAEGSNSSSSDNNNINIMNRATNDRANDEPFGGGPGMVRDLPRGFSVSPAVISVAMSLASTAGTAGAAMSGFDTRQQAAELASGNQKGSPAGAVFSGEGLSNSSRGGASSGGSSGAGRLPPPAAAPATGVMLTKPGQRFMMHLNSKN